MMATQEEVETFRKLWLAANGEMVIFTPPEGEVLKWVAKVAIAAKGTYWLIQGGRVIFYWAVGGFAAWWALKGWVSTLFPGGIGQ